MISPKFKCFIKRILFKTTVSEWLLASVSAESLRYAFLNRLKQSNKKRQEIFRHRAVVKGIYLTIAQSIRINGRSPSRNERAGISDIEEAQRIGRVGAGFSNNAGSKAYLNSVCLETRMFISLCCFSPALLR
jgi:hypothetical protein